MRKQKYGEACCQFFRFVLGAFWVVQSGCASIASRSSYHVRISSTPPGASYKIKDDSGKTVAESRTPDTAYLRAGKGYFKSSKYSIEFSKEGYASVSRRLEARIDPWYWGNFIFGGLVGLILVDPATGAMFELDEYLRADLRALPGSDLKDQMSEPAKFAPRSTQNYDGYPIRGTTVAVLTFDSRGDISSEYAAILSDRFAMIVEQRGLHRMIAREKMPEILSEQSFAMSDSCSTVTCAIEAGKSLSVRYMIFGSVSKAGSLYTINSQIVDVETTAILASSTTDWKGSIEDLISYQVENNADQLLARIIERVPRDA